MALVFVITGSTTVLNTVSKTRFLNLMLKCLFAIVFLTACQKEAPSIAVGSATSVKLNLGEILGGQNTDGYERALEPRQFNFPKDHASHPTFRNEWWYLTGNVADHSGSLYGYQLTFFRTALSPLSKQLETNANGKIQSSRWKIENMWMGHAALTDINGQRHYQQQLFSRENPGLAGAKLNPFKVWIEDWKLSSSNNDFPWQLTVHTKNFDLDLELTSVKDPVLQGDQGLSKKSHSPGNASYYYSYSRINTSGTLSVNNQKLPVNGFSWFDREWSTSALEENQIGWNWFSLQFSDGNELMYYQLLNSNNEPDPYSQGKWIDKSGASYPVQQTDLELSILESWQASDGINYPIRWKINYPLRNKSWIVQAAVKNQFMDLAVKYWEGAVIIYDAKTMQPGGRGFLEMTRTKPSKR